ncbi:hypothetical protein SAMN05421736_112124 [Evansella caseinilytica]|uniref:Uncharacterized protein n=1 Tax=Evansella caseinilytica TaxID=1503961 RepID=A0A1H3SZ97_9BACI|nr:hypothetical protein [Evansella caseinilytica]SDZ42901.1 hypothetical protein SAMN05421736_112124 [Evansella caseinilytica]
MQPTEPTQPSLQTDEEKPEEWSTLLVIIALVLSIAFIFGIGKRESVIGKPGMVHLDWP